MSPRGYRGRLALVLFGLLLASPALADAPQQALDQGIKIAFSAAPPPHPGDPVSFAFALTDSASGTPIGGVRPAAWLAARDPARAATPIDCKRQVATYLSADAFQRADFDLNSYFVLSLNDDATISVVDPLFGFGGSKLLAMLALPSRGNDWALAAHQDELFVTLPDSDKVAVADTQRWKILATLPTGAHPHRVIVVGERAWIADDAGLSFVDTHTLAPAALKLGPIAALAASEDGEWVFAAGAHEVTIVDAHSAHVLAKVPVEGALDQLAYSAAARAVYALDSAAGRVYPIDARRATLGTSITVRPGASQLRFAPDGRHALLPNPLHDVVEVLDAASNAIVQTAAIDAAPERVSFSSLLAYVQRRNSESVVMIPLAQLGAPDHALGVADFPAGQHALGDSRGTAADAIVATPDEPGALVVNAADRMIYFYQEGMAAPAGGFSTYGAIPRATLVVDHGLRELTRGNYSTRVPVKKSGDYDVVMFLDSPRVVACFSLNIPATADAPARPAIRISAVAPPHRLSVGAPARLEFALRDPAQQPAAATDLRALAFEAPGVWQRRGALEHLANGNYAFEFVPPAAGIYYVWIESETLGLARNNSQFLVYQAN